MDNDDALAAILHSALRRMKSATTQLKRQEAWYEADPTDENARQYAQAWVEMVAAREHLCAVTPRNEEMAVAS